MSRSRRLVRCRGSAATAVQPSSLDVATEHDQPSRIEFVAIGVTQAVVAAIDDPFCPRGHRGRLGGTAGPRNGYRRKCDARSKTTRSRGRRACRANVSGKFATPGWNALGQSRFQRSAQRTSIKLSV